ncbi:MAG: DUF177 domain-containing protein [Chloroflexi bacterium]|nr:DUF177 domain-containing protein [Chloroflexota bacterium]
MEINVAQLLKEPVGSTRSYEVDEELNLDGGKASFSGRILLTRLNSSILVSGKVKAALPQVCSRCLRDFPSVAPFEVEEEFFPTVDVNTGLPVEQSGEETGFTIDANHVIDLDEALRESLLVALPMKPLCQPDCVGLCPECGVNLNEEQCGCERSPKDSRWAELKRLATTGNTTNHRKKG